ncbi:hypothetical protein HGA64_05025, partial [Candidatus Falkowbacteria bacterium]|nr:hypothetical protein [Candidatus Falkowbacteria bacterium]
MKNKFDKIIDWLVIAFIFLLPWQTRLILRPGKIGNGASEYLTISLYAIDLLALLIAALYLWSNGSIWQKLRTSRKAMCIVPIFLLFFAVNIAFSADRLLAAYVWLRLTVAMTLFLAVKEKVPWRKITLGFVFGLLLPSWLAIWQFLYQGTFANKWLGLAEHVASDPGTSVIEVYPIGQKPERWLRAYGSFDHPNILGGVMAAGLLLSLWMLSRAEKDGNDRFKPFYYLAVASFAGALFVSFSRAAWL